VACSGAHQTAPTGYQHDAVVHSGSGRRKWVSGEATPTYAFLPYTFFPLSFAQGMSQVPVTVLTVGVCTCGRTALRLRVCLHSTRKVGKSRAAVSYPFPFYKTSTVVLRSFAGFEAWINRVAFPIH